MSNLTVFSGFKNSQYVWNPKKNISLNQINFFKNIDIRGNNGGSMYVSNIRQSENDNYLYYNASTGQLTYSTGGITDYVIVEDNMSLLNALIFNNGLLSVFSNSPFTIQIDTQFVDFSSITSTSDTQFKLPLIETGTYNFIIDWGDGTKDLITSYNQPSITHTYPISAVYIINIIGTCIGWSFGSAGDCLKLTDIKNWGSGFNLGTVGGYFGGCSNMIISATDTPNLTGTSSLFACFTNCSIMNSTSLSNWDVSNVTNLNSMFAECSDFNQDLSSWDVSNVTTMLGLFTNSGFNNGDVIGDSTRPLNGWNTSNVTSMSQTFGNCPFNQDISGWDTSNVTDMFGMFFFNYFFNQDITGWNVSNVTNMSLMFSRARLFNQNLNSWNVSNVSNFSNMFAGSVSVNLTNLFNNGETGFQSIPNIIPANASYTNATRTLTCTGATFTTTLVPGNVLIIQTPTIVYSSAIQSITNDTTLILVTAYGSNITIGTITSIQQQIPGTAPLNWDVSNATTLVNMFQYCIFFNQNIGNWNTQKVTTVASLFQGVASGITLFNNGQIITGTTSPMGVPTGWTFNSPPTNTNYRTNCRLTIANKPASLP